MGMLKNNKGKKIDEYESVDTRPSKAFQPFDTRKPTYHGYDRRKDAVLRINRGTQQKLKAIANMSTRQLGSNMKDVVDNIVNYTLAGFDENHLAWYRDSLKKVQKEEDKKRK